MFVRELEAVLNFMMKASSRDSAPGQGGLSLRYSQLRYRKTRTDHAKQLNTSKVYYTQRRRLCISVTRAPLYNQDRQSTSPNALQFYT
jgi:hypothetical protein